MLFLATCARADIQYVIAISIDGGRGDYLQTFIETAPTEFPNFKRLRDMSAYTFNARTDYTETITIPDHLCMLTGRPVRQPSGLPATVQHGVFTDTPGSTETVHNSGLNPGVYKASIFDTAHDRGLSTALYMGKSRLQICDRSWDATNGAADVTGADNGKDKVDVGMIQEASGTSATSTMLADFVAHIADGTLKNFTFFQIADTDYAGHSAGWSTGAGTYRNVMKVADGWIGQILDAVQNNATLSGKVAILLTADHGGGYPTNTTHTDASAAANYTIPLLLSAPGVPGGSNIYDLFENRSDAGASRPTYTDARQPMRNGDVANLCAALLGLPKVSGSLMAPEFKKPLSIEKSGSTAVVSWPAYLTGYRLESADSLLTPSWTAVSAAITEANGKKSHTATLDGTRFFRLRNVGDVSGLAAMEPVRVSGNTASAGASSASQPATTTTSVKRKPSRRTVTR